METTKDKPRHDTAAVSASTTGAATSTGDEEIESKVKRDAEEAKQVAKDKADELSEQARDAAKEKAAAGSERAAEEVDKISAAVEAAAKALEGEDREGMATYVRELGEGMTTFAERLQTRNVEQLTDDARTLARDNPAAFLLGSVAVGFGLSRFFKASAERDDSASNGAAQVPTDTSSVADSTAASMPSTGSTPSKAEPTASSATKLGESV